MKKNIQNYKKIIVKTILDLKKRLGKQSKIIKK